MWHRDNTDTIDSIKKDIRRIRRAGLSAEIFGWFLMVFAAAVIWFPLTKSRIFILYAIFVLVGLFFVYTGKYIKDGKGRRIKFALLANGIIAFPLCIGIIPIYVCIQAVINYSRFNDLPENIRELYNKPKPLRIGLRDIIFLIIVLVVGAVSIGLRLRHLDATTKKVSGPSSTVVPATTTASRYGFTITFPDSVSSTDFTQKVSGHDVSYTTYDSTANKGTEDFDVYAYNYPAPFFSYSSMPQTALAKAIHDSVNSAVQGLQGTLVKSTPSTYLGSASEDAEFTCKTLDGTTTGYMRIFFLGNNEYAIFTKGSSQSEFNDFANSFKYKGV